MNKEFDHIEQLFKDSFEDFEGNVNPEVWTNVQNAINSPAGAPNAPQPSGTSSIFKIGAKSALVKSSIAIVGLAVVGTSVFFIANNDSSTAVKDNVISEQLLPIDANNSIVETQENEEISTKEITLNSEVENKVSPEENSVSNSNENAINTTTNTNTTEVSEIPESKNKIVKEENQVTKGNLATNNSGNSNSSNNTPPIKEPLKATIFSNVKKGKAPLDVEFNVEGNAVTYLWDFGDGSPSSNLRSPFHTFKKPGEYFVSLTIIDEEANSKIINYSIEVEKVKTSSIAEVQNVFSPNGDGVNDVIKIEGKDIVAFEAIVRDTKGNLVFEWKNIDGFWDGKDLNNNKLPKGTYYLVVRAKGNDGENHVIQKSIQLF